MRKIRVFLGCLVLGFSAVAADNQKPSASTRPVQPVLATQARTIVMQDGTVGEIYCRMNDATMIALPEGEEALVVTGGDAAPKGTWLFQTAANGPARRYIDIKPTVAGATTTLHIITSRNLAYSFIVREISNAPRTADVVVRVVPSEERETRVAGPAVFVSADEANRYKQQAAEALAKLEAERKQAEAKTRLERTQYPKSLDHAYRFKRLKAPFHVTDVATDGTFTYVSVDPQHTKAGAIYTEEGKKHKANLPNFTYDAEKGVYTITGVVERGYMTVQDARIEFAHLEGGKQ